MGGPSGPVQPLREQSRPLSARIPAVVWRQAPDGSAEFLNQRFREYTGLSLEGGRGWGWMNASHPEDRAMDEWRAALAAGEPFEKEARLRRAERGALSVPFGVLTVPETANTRRWNATSI